MEALELASEPREAAVVDFPWPWGAREQPRPACTLEAKAQEAHTVHPRPAKRHSGADLSSTPEEVHLVLRRPAHDPLGPSQPGSCCGRGAEEGEEDEGRGLVRGRAQSPARGEALPASAQGVRGIELREQGHEAALLSTIAQLREELAGCEAERSRAAGEAARRAQECANLRDVVRELAASRQKLVTARAVLTERFVELQQEYCRALRSADLARGESRENKERARRAAECRRLAEAEAESVRRSMRHVLARNARLQARGRALRARLTLASRLGGWLEQHAQWEWLEPVLWLLRAIGEPVSSPPSLSYWPEKP